MTPTIPRPSTFKRPRLLIVGCGDIGMRVLRLLRGRWRVFALSTDVQRREALRAVGAVPLIGDLDDRRTLGRLATLADRVLHLAPPELQGDTDRRTANLLHALARGGGTRRIVYVGTSGVYGDCGGARFDETRALHPATARARRRADAEARLRWHGRQHGVKVALLRVPGIYANDRVASHPRARLARGTPLLAAQDDVFTNHIHADDLARACLAALHRALPQRAIHVCDDSELRMGEYFDLAADLLELPRAPRIERAEAAAQLSPTQLSFMSESRRLCNRRLKRELKLRLLYPTVTSGLLAPTAPGDRR